MMMKNTIAMVRAALWQTVLEHLEVEPAGKHREQQIAPKAPTAPASLGVAQPSRIEHLIMPIRNTGGKKARHSSGSIWPLGTASSSGGSGGASLGQIDATMKMNSR